MARMLRNLVGVKPQVDGADLKRYVCISFSFYCGIKESIADWL